MSNPNRQSVDRTALLHHRSITARAVLSAALGFFMHTASAADQVTVLGVPLGGKITPALKVCPFDTDDSKSICWVGKPFVSKDGTRLGTVHLPNPNSRAEWAAYAGFNIFMAKDGTIDLLKVTVRDVRAKNVIAESISSRFGLPQTTTLQRDDLAEARWRGEGIEVRQVCIPSFCEVRFMSAAALRNEAQEKEAAARVKMARPVAP